MEKYKITVLLGTAKEGNFSKDVSKFVVKELEKNEKFEVKHVDVKDFLYGKTTVEGDTINGWKEIIESTDGLVVVSPEYNHSIPGELKILLDSLYTEYTGKVAATVGTSMGGFAGSRMLEHLKIVLHTINFDICLRTGNFAGVRDDWSKDSEKYEKQITGIAEEIISKLSK
ncbi:MAG: NAD(P)H-dependent FMN reductase [Candidatus Paceibacteria bacterium]|jgi:NAD(P)H-dependent FMN reductase